MLHYKCQCSENDNNQLTSQMADFSCILLLDFFYFSAVAFAGREEGPAGGLGEGEAQLPHCHGPGTHLASTCKIPGLLYRCLAAASGRPVSRLGMQSSWGWRLLVSTAAWGGCYWSVQQFMVAAIGQ